MKPATTTGEPSADSGLDHPPGTQCHAEPQPQGNPLVQIVPQARVEPQAQIDPPTQAAPVLNRLAWFVLIWLCSVGVLAVVAGLIRWAIKP